MAKVTIAECDLVFQPFPDNPRFIDRTGEVTDGLTVIGFAGRIAQGSQIRSFWFARCECGNIARLSASTLGRVKSCGCRKLIGPRLRHGLSHTKTHNIWISLRQRCNNPNQTVYKWYGGRGIKVCKRWDQSFDMFLKDMGECPKDMSIDRIDPDGPYSPGNCRWADKFAQANNRSSNKIINFDDHNKTIAEWSRYFRVSQQIVSARIRRGWCLECTFNREATECVHNNSKNVPMVTAFGTSKTRDQFCDEYNIKEDTFRKRVARGWCAECALTIPAKSGVNVKCSHIP